jgi:hypothetical protein
MTIRTTGQVFLAAGAASPFQIAIPPGPSITPYMAIPFPSPKVGDPQGPNGAELRVQWFSTHVDSFGVGGPNPVNYSIHTGVFNTSSFDVHFTFVMGALS